MKVIVVKNQLEGGKIGLDLLKESINNGAKTLGLATGSTPVEFYNQIVNSDLDFTNMVSVNLDEYLLKLQLMLLTFKKAQSKLMLVSLNQKQMYHVKQFQWGLHQL